MKTVVITGANRGIGLELARSYKKEGASVIALVRHSSKALDALEVRVEEGLDIGKDSVVDALRTRLSGVQIDLLVLNAGVLSRDSLVSPDFDAIRHQLEVNTLGPLRVVSALLPHLHPGSKVGIVTSRMGSIADNGSGGMYGYRISKAGVNMVGKSLAVDLKPRGVAVALIHPGFVRTEMTGGTGMVDASEAAAGISARLEELTLENTGTFWHMNGEPLPW